MGVNFTALLQGIVQNSPDSVEDFAREAGRSRWMFYRALNPHDEKVNPNIRDLVAVMRKGRDITPLQVLADDFGFILVPKRLTDLSASLDKQMAKDFHVVSRAHLAMEAEGEPEEVMARACDAAEEIMQTVLTYLFQKADAPMVLFQSGKVKVMPTFLTRLRWRVSHLLGGW